MKKLIALLLALIMVLSLSACGKDDTTSDGDTSKETENNYSELSTNEKIDYILGSKTNYGYENELIGIGFNYSWDYNCKAEQLEDTDYTEEYLKTLEDSESVQVFSGYWTVIADVTLKKMSQSEIDNLDLETYTKGKLENSEISRRKIADIPTYVAYREDKYFDEDTRAKYFDYTYFFVIECDGYLAEFTFNYSQKDTLDQILFSFYPLDEIEPNIKPKNSMLDELYNTYLDINSFVSGADGYTDNTKILLSETDKNGNEIKRVYGYWDYYSEKETVVMYNPNDNTLSIGAVDAGFYDDYSFEDGTIIEFNENNKPICSKLDARETPYVYNDEGRLIEYNIKESSHYIKFEYSDDGKKVKATSTTSLSERQYDDNGLLIEIKYYDIESPTDLKNGRQYEYDSRGRVIKETYINDDGTLSDSYNEYKYDINGVRTIM